MADEEPTRGIGDNKPPLTLAETAKAEITDQIAPLLPRLNELKESYDRRLVANCQDREEVGKCADLVKLMTKLDKRIDNVRGDVKEPYLEATQVVDAAAKAPRGEIKTMIEKLRALIKAFETAEYQKEQEARRQEEADRRKREAEERDRQERERKQRLADEARAAEQGVKLAPEPEPAPIAEKMPEAPKRQTRAPIATGDYGSSAHRVVRKIPQIEDVYALPPEVLNAPKVHDAILTVVRAMRTGNPDIEIQGIKIVDDVTVGIR